jgi:hypothetical protein
MLRIAANRTVLSASSSELAAARQQLFERGFVKLEGLLAGSLLERIQHAIHRASFYRRVHDGIGVELCAEPGIASGVLEFLTNDEALRAAVADLARSGPIGCFEGRIYRIVPGTEHHDSWHSDVGDDRLLALSINLGIEPFEGGQLQLRRADSAVVIGEVENTVPGDGVLFRIDPSLRHRVAPVSGRTPRTAYAGWFRTRPAYRDLLAKRFQSHR